MTDPITGPLSRDEFRALWLAPYGTALDRIRKFDPLYGRKPGDKIGWRVTLRREIQEIGTATVLAATEDEATELADKLTEAEIDWEADYRSYRDDKGTIETVEPERGRDLYHETPPRLGGLFDETRGTTTGSTAELARPLPPHRDDIR